MHEEHMNRAPKWDLYRYFLAVAKTASITGAAQLLRESPPTVSRKVRELEAHFADALFRRPPGRLELSPAGQRLQERLARIEQDMGDLHADLAGGHDRLSGQVTITAPRGFGKAVLLECLGRLRHEMPDVEFVTMFKMRKLNLRHREADIAIRVGDPGDDGMLARHIGDIQFGVYASTTYLNKHGVPQSPDDLRPRDYIGLEGGDDLVQVKAIKNLITGLSAGMSVDCILLQAQAVSMGLGFASLPRYMTASFPNLVEILPGAISGEAGLWALVQPDASRSACVSATLAALVVEAKRATT